MKATLGTMTALGSNISIKLENVLTYEFWSGAWQLDVCAALMKYYPRPPWREFLLFRASIQINRKAL